jgi:unsaturated chondroitin disaccharide hydrolase
MADGSRAEGRRAEGKSRADAVAAMLGRIDRTISEPEDGFPHFADPNTGVWTRSPAGDWTGGFWVGQLWLAAWLTGERRYHDEALSWAEKLRPRASSETVFRGFIFWYGAAIGAILTGDDEARRIALEGAAGLAQLYDPVARAIPLGPTAEEASSVGRTEANIDGVPGGTPLLAWASANGGRPSLMEMALAHAERHIELCVRDDGSVCQSASFDPATGALIRRYTHKGIHDDSTWTRAQAWAMLGFAQAMSYAPERFAVVATRVANWWLDRLPRDGVAYWDFDAPRGRGTERDTSGTAIAGAALLKLAALLPDRADEYRTVAEAMFDAMIARHLTPVESGDRRPVGILTDGCYNRRIGLATQAELVWGDYFLFESLLVLEGRLDPALT